jgi:hypothetical protein
MAGDLNVQHEKVLRTMLVLDSLRGEDSTGVATIGKFIGADVRIAKQVGDPFQLFDHKSYDAAFKSTSRVMIGHNRYATVGGVSRQTAHPFENDLLVGAHNGTLKNKWVLDKHQNFKVDSENLYHHISKFGLADALRIIDGAWALTWWDKEEETLNLLRNKERPLFWCVSRDAKDQEDGKVFFWASEAWMLNVALNRHGINHSDIKLLQVDTHFKIPVGNGGTLGKPVVRDAPGLFEKNRFQQNRSPVVVNNVVQLPAKKEGGDPVEAGKKQDSSSLPGSNSASSFDRHYLRAKNVLFELMEGHPDKDGVEFMYLFDPKRPYFEIRLYPESMKDTIWDMTGSDVSADISVWVPGTTPGKGYYKVKANSVRVLATLEEDEKPLETRPGASGKQMNIVEWQRAYPACSWCSSPLEFGVAKFTTASEAFCPDCAKLPDVLEAVKF